MNEREVFLTVVDEQGFSSAAIKLDTTPAAVSRKVKKLEERLGVRLLHRTTRSIRLTPEGELYYQQAKSLLEKLNMLEQDLGAKKGQLRGTLKIAAPNSIELSAGVSIKLSAAFIEIGDLVKTTSTSIKGKMVAIN